MAFFEQGSRVWYRIPEKNNLCMAATVVGNDGTQSTFQGDDGQTYTVKNAAIGPDTVTQMHDTSKDGLEDMAKLADLHEGAILHNIALRYRQSNIYTYIGSILSAVNPYKDLKALYSDEQFAAYREKAIGDKPPHIYALANEAYFAMSKSDANQVMLISGESGAGKTESTKFIMRYLSYLSNDKARTQGMQDSKKKSFEDQILSSSPILEGFGNAKTVYNNNSSRFGKFVKVSFSTNGVIEGGRIIDYLLEKSRVTKQNPMERNFHIFYQLLVGGPVDQLKLTRDPKQYRYLNQSGVFTDPTIDDKRDWNNATEAFTVMNFTPEQTNEVLKALAAILHMGNVDFIVAGGAQIANDKVLNTAADLIGLDAPSLGEALTNITRELRGEVITTPMDMDQAADARDSLAMSLYAQLFKWIISKLNTSLKGNDTWHSIGVLDIFGFENFKVNSLEQFNINYANEKLQQYFNRHIFSLEQLEYNRENISWAEIEWVDNGECLDLVERKLGILSLLDEESRMVKGTDESLLSKLHGTHAGNSTFYIKPRIVNSSFGIKHYAGDVLYESKGFLDKNRDTFRTEFISILENSKNDFIYDLFEHLFSDQAGGKDSKGARKKTTVSLQFKESLASLMQTLSQANPFFVRCLKPNARKAKDDFDYDLVLNQLRYSGMLETVRIRRAGYPVRRVFADFLFRYKVLAQNVAKSLPLEKQCAEVLKKVDAKGKDWQIGATKAFLRESLETELEKRRTVALKATMDKIRAVILQYVMRKRYLATRRKIIAIQTWWKCAHYRNVYQKTRKSAIKIQAVWRGYKARQLRAKLAEQRRIEMERKKEEERKRAEQMRLEMERLERESRDKAEAAKRMEEIRRQQAAEEAAKLAKKAEEEAKMRADMEKAKNLDADLRAKDDERQRKQEEERQNQEREKLFEAKRKAAEAKDKADREAAQREAELQKKREIDEARLEEAEERESIAEVNESYEGYLGMYRGVMKGLRRRWVVLHDNLLMWFKSRQDNLKSGWMSKLGGGTSTLGRKNWKRRWFSLRGSKLYYMASEDDDAEVLGEVDVQHCSEVAVDTTLKKENCFQVTTDKRTYFMCTDTVDEMNEWIAVLNSVKGASDDEIKVMLANARVDPRHAQGTIEVDDILSCGPGNKTDQEGHPIFVVMCSDQETKFVASDNYEMENWLRVLQPKRSGGAANAASLTGDSERGYMLKAGGRDGKGALRRRWFVLHNTTLSYYKSKGDETPLSSIALNSLCSVVPPLDDAVCAVRNEWPFVLHTKVKSYHLVCKTQADCVRWINALQDVMDNAEPVETQTDKLIDELKVASGADAEWIISQHKILSYSAEPIKAPLLPLPYGDVGAAPNTERVYGSLQDEAVKISNTLCPADGPRASLPRHGSANPVETIKSILQACFDLPKLRNEVYCQVIKQTTAPPTPGSAANMMHWHLFAALCCSFLPSRKYLRHARFFLRRTIETPYMMKEIVDVAEFCMEALKRTKNRDFAPSMQEIEAIVAHQPLKITVTAVGGKCFEFPINSSTTCGEIVHAVKSRLGLQKARNGFGLFESCSVMEKYLEERLAVSDVMAKWEKYEQHGINPEGDRWKLVFKLFAYFAPRAKDLSPTEQEFLFEQAFDNVINRRFPADDATQIKLAALRTQYTVGDYEEGFYLSDLEKVHPAQQEQLLAPDAASSGAAGTLKKAAGTVLKGTLKGLGMGTLKKLKGSGSLKRVLTVSDAELAKIKERIVAEWRNLRKMTKVQAQQQYMSIVEQWGGYGCNLFDVEQTSHKHWPKDLWLAISLEGVGVYARNEAAQLALFKYEAVLSFGAPVANRYKIMVDNVGSMLFETSMVLEIAKLMKEYIKEIVTRKNKQGGH